MPSETGARRRPFFVTHFLERHTASSDQRMKKLTSLDEGLHVMMQYYMRQHFTDRFWLHEHPGGHALWRKTHDEKIHKRIDHVLCARTCVQMEHSDNAMIIQ